MTVPGDYALWTKTIAPALRDMFPGAATYVSGPIVENLPLEDCGDFVWALVCITRGVPDKELIGFKYFLEREDKPKPDQRELLLRGALEAPDFHQFSEGSLAKLLFRLKRNVECCEASSPEELAHAMILKRFEDIIHYLAERHPNAQIWLAERPKQVATTRNGQHLRIPRKRPDYLRVVRT